MTKKEFLELYQQVGQMCGGSQQQAGRLAELVRDNLSLYAGAKYPSYRDIKNGSNMYRSIFLLESYRDHGSDIEAAWRPGIAAINYWNYRDRDEDLPLVLPLKESEIIYSEQEGEKA